MEYLPPPDADEPQPEPVRRKASGVLGGIGTIAVAAVAFLSKFKLALLLGAKVLAPGWTFLLSLWIYVAFFGWKIAVVLMLLLLAHELGHYFAFRAYGLPVRLPAFVPLFGAFTAGAPPEDLEHDAYIALAGPLTGLALAAACYGVALQTSDRFWYACADMSAFLNLFNMIPMPPFDGGRVIGALQPVLWLAGFLLFGVAAIYLHIPLIFVIVIALLGVPTMMAALKGQVDPRAARMTNAARLRVGVWYLATLFGLFYVMMLAHGVASPNAGSTNW